MGFTVGGSQFTVGAWRFAVSNTLGAGPAPEYLTPHGSRKFLEIVPEQLLTVNGEP